MMERHATWLVLWKLLDPCGSGRGPFPCLGLSFSIYRRKTWPPSLGATLLHRQITWDKDPPVPCPVSRQHSERSA